MKKLIAIAVSLLFVTGMVKGQSKVEVKAKVSTKAEVNPDAKAKVDVKAATTRDSNSATFPGIILINNMDQRLIYRWDNGQSSTASGRQAGDPTAKYARVFGDSAVVVRDWSEKIKPGTNGTVKH